MPKELNGFVSDRVLLDWFPMGKSSHTRAGGRSGNEGGVEGAAPNNMKM